MHLVSVNHSQNSVNLSFLAMGGTYFYIFYRVFVFSFNDLNIKQKQVASLLRIAPCPIIQSCVHLLNRRDGLFHGGEGAHKNALVVSHIPVEFL